MALSTVAKTKVFIGGTAAADDLAEFEALTWTEIESVQSVGDFGDEAMAVEVELLRDARKRRMKGTVDAGVFDLLCARDPTDEGQTALKAAFASPLDHNFRVELNDVQVSGGEPTTFYFRGAVLSQRNAFGDNNTIIGTTFTVGINTDILEVVAELVATP